MKNLTVVLSVTVALAAPPALAQRISFADFSGPGAGAVRNQLVTAVCDTADCIAAAKTTTRGKPDWKKAKKAAVSFIVTGAVVKKGKGKALDLQVLDKAGPAKARRTFPLEKSGTLSAKNLQAAIELMQGAFGGGGEATPPVKPPPPEPKRPEPEPKRPEPEPAKPAPVASKPEPEPLKPAPEPEPEPAKPGKRTKKGAQGPLFLAAEVGASVLGRNLDYVQASTPNLRRYAIFPFPQIDARVEFYPLALVRDDGLSGLGVDLSVGLAPYLKSRRQSSAEAYPTSTMRIAGGFRFRWSPFDSYRAAVIPMLGVDVRSFTVGATSDGTTLDGLPNVSFVGLRAGLGLELPILTDLLTFFGRFCAVPVFSSGQLISSAYFPNGSTFGLDANAGLSLKVLSFLSIRVAFEFEQYASSFKTEATDTYVAAGSVDRYLGGSAAVRLEF
ncbi:MAG: hypothetical protein AB1730_09630 [Myxococcota bacterium]|jgi:outer membrane biosynthesis protein TonB